MSGRKAWPIVVGTVLLVWFLGPLLPLGVWAVADRWVWPATLPQEWGGRGLREAHTQGIGGALLRSSLLGLAVAAVATPLGALAGRALGWRLLDRSWAVSVLLLAPVALPPFAVAMGLDAVVLRLAIPAPVAVVAVLAVFALPYATYVMRAAYTAVDPLLEEQARMLGATAPQAFRRATLPALVPAVLAAAALAFLVGWSDYVVTVLIGGAGLITAPVLLASAASGTGNEPVVAVISLLSLSPTLAALALAAVVRRRRGTSLTERVDER